MDIKQLLTDYRCYEFAVNNIAEPENPDNLYSERIRNLNTWDWTRYVRIVNLVKKAIEEALTDDQQTFVRKYYIARNRMTTREIREATGWSKQKMADLHVTALKRLNLALAPLLSEKEMEITPFHHMFHKSA